MTDPQIRQDAFTKIMGSIDMPPDDSPDYDEWLFDKSFAAGRSAGLEEGARLVEYGSEDLFCGNSRRRIAKALREAAILKRKEGQ